MVGGDETGNFELLALIPSANISLWEQKDKVGTYRLLVSRLSLMVRNVPSDNTLEDYN